MNYDEMHCKNVPITQFSIIILRPESYVISLISQCGIWASREKIIYSVGWFKIQERPLAILYM